MSTRRTSAVVLLGAIVVLLVCWFAWNAKTDETRVSTVVQTTSLVARAEDLAHDTTTSRERAAEGQAQGTPPPSRADSSANRSLNVRGRCVDRNGQPVGGARVELTEISWWPNGQELAKSVYGGALQPSGSLPHAQSAADGAFAIPVQLEDESPHGCIATVVARQDGLCRAEKREFRGGHGDLDVGDLVLEPGSLAKGRVHDTLGNPCAGVRMFLWAKGRTTKSGRVGDDVRSAADGHFEFRNAPAAQCELSAWADDLRRAQLDVDLASGPQTNIEVMLPELRGMDSISGVVVDPEGHPVKGAWLLETATAGPEPRVNVQTACDDNGRFRIDGRPDSTFVLTTVDREHRWCAVRKADITSGTHDIVLQLDGSKTFVLRVRGDGGETIERFGYQRFSNVLHAQALTEVGDHPGGDATLASDLEPFSLEVTAPGWHSARVEKIDTQNLPSIVPVVLHRACVLRGVVRGVVCLEKTTERAWVRAEECKLTDALVPNKPARPPADALTDANGRFEMTVQGTGTLRLRATWGTVLSALTEAISVKPGEDVGGLMIEFIPTGSIEGSALRADGSHAAQLSIIATQDGKSIQSVQADEQGRYRFADLPPGVYLLIVKLELGWMHLTDHGLGVDRAVQSWRARVDAAVATKLELRLLETARLHVTLGLPTPPQSNWVADVSILDPSGGSDLLEKQIHGNETVDLERVDPFEAVILITCFQQGWPRFTVPTQTFERGSRDVSIAVSTGRIEGNVTAPFAADESIQLNWSGPSLSAQATATIDAAGRFTFECVPAGECSLVRSSRSNATRTVAVRSSELTRVDDL